MMDDTKFLEALRQRHRAGEPLNYLFFWGHRPRRLFPRLAKMKSESIPAAGVFPA